MMNSQQQQTPQPTRSTPLHRPSKTPMLPTPSSSRSATLTLEQLLQTKLDLEQQLADKEQQCQDCESGIQKNVLTRQISQIRDKLVELDQQIHQVQQHQQLADDISPATIDKIRHLERDLATYRGQQRKDKPFPQRGLDILPSPSTSTLLPPNTTASSLLPLPPPPSGSTPTKRRSKVPNNDRRNTDIEFATEIGQGLLIEVRKMQAILQEKEEQLRALEIQKADLERSAEAMAKQLRQREENEEKLKEETWNLELTKQELTLSVTELQQHLHKATSEQTKLTKQTHDLRSDIDQLRDREEKLTALLETTKQRHEQDMTSLRRHCAGLQREAQQHAKHIDTLTSELAIAKAQSRLGKHQSAATSGTTTTNNNNVSGPLESDDSDPSSSQDPHYRSGTSSNSPPSSPKQSPVGGRTAQAMEVETLKTSLAHAHRMVSNLRSHLHKEKTEKFEFKKLLAESQETIEQLQNDPHLWVDAPGSHQGGVSANGSLDDQKKRKVKQHRRATRKLHRGGMGNSNNSNGTPPLSSSRSISSKHHGGDNDSFDDDDDDDDAYSYSSVSEEDDDNAPAGFTSLSLELSQSTAKINDTAIEMGVMTDDIIIVHDKHHYEQQLEKLYQLEQWHQAHVDKSTGWTSHAQLSMDQTPVISCETITQTDSAPTVDVALQTYLPDSVHQECQCDLIQPRDEEADSLALAAAVSAATKEADTKSAEAMAAAATKAKEDKAAAVALAKHQATMDAEAKSAAAITAAVELATLKANEEAAATLSAAVESATTEAEAKSAAAISAAVESAILKANEEAAIALSEAVESATVKANEEAAIALSAAVESATMEAEAKSAAAISAAVESAILKANEEAAIALSEAMESATAKANEEAAIALSAAVLAAREDAIAETKATLATEVEVNTAKAVTQAEADTTAKVNKDTAVAIAAAVESATIKAKEEAALELSRAVESATIKANEEAALELSRAVESATIKANEEAALELSRAVESAITKAAEEAAFELSRAVESAKHEATIEAEAKSELLLSAAVATATEKANEAAKQAAKDAEAKSIAAMSAAVEAATAKAKEEAVLERSSIPTMDQGIQCSCEGIDMASQVDEIVTMDTGVQHESHLVDTSVQYEYTSVDQETQYDVTPLTIDTATQHESVIDSKDVATQYEVTTALPSMIDVGTDPIDDGIGARLYNEEQHGGLIATSNSPKDSQVRHGTRNIGMAAVSAATEYRNVASNAAVDNNNDWLGSLNDDGPISLDKSMKLATPSDAVYTNETDHKLYSQDEMNATVAKTTPRNNDRDGSEQIVPARPTQRPPSTLLDKATRNSSSITHAATSTENSDDAGTFSGLNRQASLGSSYMTNENNHMPSRPSNTAHYGASSSSAAGITPPSITSSIHDEHSIMVRPLPSTPDPTISSITQTMIGEWLTKYTRKPMGGQGFSERRHERYFWIHPYTRTLYWCTRAPGAEGGELKAKSAFVENVTVGKADDDTLDGIPCLLIQTSTRQLKIKAPTKERHDMWLESLMYLLTRGGQYSTLEPTPSLMPQRSVSASVLRKPSFQRMNDIFSRTASASHYTPEHQHDDDDDALENVRLCCDGKHDVGRLEKNHNHRPAYHQRKQHQSSSLDHSHQA